MTQSRGLSALEAVVNVLAGLVVAFAVQLAVFPVLGLAATLAQNATLAAVFTLVSFLRSYAVRRAFDRWSR